MRRSPSPVPVDGLKTLSPPPYVGPAPDVPQAVALALDALGRFGRLTLIVNDPQRHTDSPAVLRVLAGRVDAARVRLLLATGTHCPSPPGREAFERALLDALPAGEIAWHDARAEGLPPVGALPTWRAHPWVAAAEAVLAVGSTEPHYFAGFTGAHKTCTIGVASRGDIEAHHARALDPAAAPGRLAQNPAHQGAVEMLAALEAVAPVAAVNLVQAGPKVLLACGGRPLEALHAAAGAAEDAFFCRLDRPADAIVAEVTGPLGRSFYQADKGIKNNEGAVRDGGVLVLAAPCREGIGQDDFVRLLREAADYRQAAETVRVRGYRLGDHKAVRLRRLTDPAGRGVRAFVVSDGLSEADAALLGLAKAASVADALRAGGVDPRRDRAVRVPDAGNVCATVGRP
jgi:nickel-dependent lactate racemase